MRKLSSIFIGIGIFFLSISLLLSLYNVWDTKRANEAAADTLEILESNTSELTTKEEGLLDYQLNPGMDMPVQEVNGQLYIGTIDLKSISVSLPVISDWDYKKLKLAPCRYSGSAYQPGFVIMAHNFSGHFGKLAALTYGSPVTFTDVSGNRFEYQVADIEVLERTAVDEMKSDQWDLTLFTCTLGGSSRVTIRCERI